MSAVDYRDWIGRKQTREDLIALAPARRLLATLDDGETVLNEGDPLPPLWHWIYFLPDAPQSKVAHDGHAQTGDFMPPIALPRRMFAGTSVDFHAPLPLGAPARLETEVIDVQEKTGKSGALAFVTVRRRIFAGATLALEERQSIVYRAAGGRTPAPGAKPLPAPPPGAWSREITADPVMLFRYSALTFNAHRIHYDRPYAMEEEGYPGLIVHGPLLATLLVELVRRNAGRPVRHFAFRASAPIFDGAPFRVQGAPDGDTVGLLALRCDGETAMQAEARLA